MRPGTSWHEIPVKLGRVELLPLCFILVSSCLSEGVFHGGVKAHRRWRRKNFGGSFGAERAPRDSIETERGTSIFLSSLFLSLSLSLSLSLGDRAAICLVRAESGASPSIHRAFIEQLPVAIMSLKSAVRIIGPWRQFAVVKKLRHHLLYENVFTRDRLSKLIGTVERRESGGKTDGSGLSSSFSSSSFSSFSVSGSALSLEARDLASFITSGTSAEPFKRSLGGF